MHARVATFEGAQPEQVRQLVDYIKTRAPSGPPEGVPATGLLLLHRAEEGKVISVSLFETEDDLRRGDEALKAMDPPVPAGAGRRSSVEFYEVGVKLD